MDGGLEAGNSVGGSFTDDREINIRNFQIYVKDLRDSNLKKKNYRFKQPNSNRIKSNPTVSFCLTRC